MDKKPKTLFVKYYQNANIRPIPEEAERTLQVYPALGIGYLASYLRKSGYPVSILDAHALELTPDEYKNAIAGESPDIIGITATTIGWPGAVDAARLAREAAPDALIVCGGPQLSVYPRECLSFPFIDVGVMGDGEETLLEIARRKERGESLNDIHGTVVKVDGEVKINPARPWLESLDDLPFPAADLIPFNKYKCLTVENPFATMITSRGCPFKCGFCSQVYCGDTVRFRSPQNVVDEMEMYVARYGVKEIILFDETFTLGKERVMEVCRLIRQKNLHFRWNIRTRVDTIDEEMMAALKQVGCYGLHMGVEAGDPGILQKMNKGITHEKVRKAFASARKLGFQTRGYFMIGYIDETMETFKATVEMAKELDLDWASFSITTPLPHTPLYEEAMARGYLTEDYWKKYTLLQTRGNDFPHIINEHWNEKQLIDMMNQAYRSFYMRPQFIMKRLKSLRSWKNFLDLFRGAKIIFLMKD